ncbi:hypothetical protein JXO59_07910 [candidate division KSB1 bacterium]|nr:hypothetical protein [candidate division KSB1 bacterium]
MECIFYHQNNIVRLFYATRKSILNPRIHLADAIMGENTFAQQGPADS